MTTPTPVEVTQKDLAAWERYGPQIFNCEITGPEVLARHRTEALASAAGEPVGYIIGEMLNRRREYERNDIVMTATPQGMSTLPLYKSPPLASQRALVEMCKDDPNWICAGIPDDVIEAGVLAWDNVNADMARDTPDRDWDEGMIVAAVYKAMLRAALSLTKAQEMEG